MALAALQKLSIRDEVQAVLIREGCVEWLVDTLSKARTLPPYTQEYAAALLMNLTLRSAGRARCVPLAPTLLPSLTQLLATVPAHVIPYVTGALYSLLSHPTLRQEAFDLGLDTTLRRLSQGGSQEQRRQLEYIIGEIQRDPPISPPPSPDPMLDMEEDPEWLEEELDVDDPVKPPPHAPVGEELLAWRYTIHAEEKTLDTDRSFDGRQPRSAPVMNWAPLPSLTLPRPNTDGAMTAQLKKKHQAANPQWDYPSDPEERGQPFSERSSLSESFCPASNAWTRRESSDYDHQEVNEQNGNIWIRGEEEVRDWAMSLRSGTRTPRQRRLSQRASATVAHGQQSRIDEVTSSNGRQETISAANGNEYYGQDRKEVEPTPSYSQESSQNAVYSDSTCDESSTPAGPEPSAFKHGRQSLRMTEKRQISLDDHEALVIPRNISTSEKSASGDDYPQEDPEVSNNTNNSAVGVKCPHEPQIISVNANNLETSASATDSPEENDTSTLTKQPESDDGTPSHDTLESKEALDRTEEQKEDLDSVPATQIETPSKLEDNQETGIPFQQPIADEKPQEGKEKNTTMYDVVASKILEQIVGQSREVPSATSTPDNDPLLKSLPQRKVTEYKAAFSSRPRIARTPPRSAAKGGHAGSPDTHLRHQNLQKGDTGSPRAVLPPISSNNHNYTKAVT